MIIKVCNCVILNLKNEIKEKKNLTEIAVICSTTFTNTIQHKYFHDALWETLSPFIWRISF